MLGSLDQHLGFVEGTKLFSFGHNSGHGHTWPIWRLGKSRVRRTGLIEMDQEISKEPPLRAHERHLRRNLAVPTSPTAVKAAPAVNVA